MPPLLSAYLQGFALSGGLIVAIGAQNAFVLRQGLRREHVLLIATLCFVSDALLIALGCAGFGSLVQSLPRLVTAVRYIGAAFLIVYGLRSARAALRPGALEAQSGGGLSRRQALLTVLALTWLNPHVYLDTVLLVGGLAGRYPAEPRAAFALGAASVSALWFYGLGFGAAYLAPLFRKPATWRALDMLIALTMFAIALSLLRGA
ncbi:L-lysine exporter family protein LysE/ArgO [Solimonas aquatica]|uniref:L-lysine exporter family protein LysE/ArgO n=1 Tax=Solimonas aquatica TaxID=489703 RepID=A0A1H9M0A1_9GAMM|nr:LysE/ArgO family amino acid transporter [Solimonas aquatica]SER17009.1 L-lysine exporter family protein LysE/ArgO [Solimonas aquatica]